MTNRACCCHHALPRTYFINVLHGQRGTPQHITCVRISSVGSSLTLAGTFPPNRICPSVTEILQAVSFSKRHRQRLASSIVPEPLIGEAKPHLLQLTQIDEGHLPLPIASVAAEVHDPQASKQVAGQDCTYPSLQPRPVPSGTDSGYNSPHSSSRNPSGFYNQSTLVWTSLEDLSRGFEECKGSAQQRRSPGT